MNSDVEHLDCELSVLQGRIAAAQEDIDNYARQDQARNNRLHKELQTLKSQNLGFRTQIAEMEDTLRTQLEANCRSYIGLNRKIQLTERSTGETYTDAEAARSEEAKLSSQIAHFNRELKAVRQFNEQQQTRYFIQDSEILKLREALVKATKRSEALQEAIARRDEGLDGIDAANGSGA
ncbi:hypothetical protein EUX98_g2604 [Antrodiella citrinella]|uniref:Uncharacterized protein n=1 Tax=Antrodiella citrinella TaxID=2447956 RepID=A0A4S4N1H2_9APHY|nr:hypothetical protein EUX98_g2604 [Antrodiella citrinella]